MNKTSAAVLAFLFASTQAVQLNFASGFDGQEDMGEDIEIRGEPFHFIQKDTKMVQLHAEPTVEDDGKEDLDAPKGKAAAMAAKPGNGKYEWWTRGDPAEKVSFVDPVIAREHTTFYAQKDGEEKKAPAAPEKVHVLNPNEAIAESNGPNAFPSPWRTAFYDKVNNMWRESTVENMAQQEDIRNKHVRPDVYLTVKHAISSTALPREEEAPKKNPYYDHAGSPLVMNTDASGYIKMAQVDPIAPAGYEPWVYKFSKDHMTPHLQWHDREKGAEAPKPDARYYSFAQDEGTQPTPVGAPEKVHVLEPRFYQNVANTNTPNIRTTFYNARHGVWMEAEPMEMM